MFKIEGDGSRRNTRIWRDGELIENWNSCHFFVDEDVCNASVDNITGELDTILIKGIYMIIGNGSFQSTKVFLYDEMLRGVQYIEGLIHKDEPPELTIKTIMLPNIIEFPPTPPHKVDERLVTFGEEAPRRGK